MYFMWGILIVLSIIIFLAMVGGAKVGLNDVDDDEDDDHREDTTDEIQRQYDQFRAMVNRRKGE